MNKIYFIIYFLFGFIGNAQADWLTQEIFDNQEPRVIEEGRWMNQSENSQSYFGAGAQYGRFNGKENSGIIVELGKTLGYQDLGPGADSAYQRGYHDGYRAGRHQQRHIYRKHHKNRYYNQGAYNNFDNELNDELYDRSRFYTCKLKVNYRNFTAKGKYRDRTQQRAYQACRKVYSKANCQRANIKCDLSW